MKQNYTLLRSLDQDLFSLILLLCLVKCNMRFDLIGFMGLKVIPSTGKVISYWQRAESFKNCEAVNLEI